MADIERLFLIDAMALAYRAYFAFIRQPLRNSKGQNTSAVYGFVTFLNRILSQEYPEHIAAVFDTGKPTFRHKKYKEYKATRQKMPDDMAAQIPILKEVVRAYNIPVIELEGFEADDIIGTLAKQAEKKGALTFLVTPDKDFMQLVSEKTKIYKPGKQGTDIEIIDIEGVKERFGVAPDKVIEVLGLTGDTSDNIPGVPGIGEKTAIPIIQKYGSIDMLYAHIDEITQRGVRSKLEAGRDLAVLSKELVTIDTDVPLPVDFHSLKAEKPDSGKISKLFEELEFRSLLTKFKSDNIAATPPAGEMNVDSEIKVNIRNDEHVYSLITTEEGLSQLCGRLESADEFVFDTETTSTDALNAELVGISFCLKPREAFFVAVTPEKNEETGLFKTGADSTVASAGLSPQLVCGRLKSIFRDSRIRKIGHNIKYDMLVLSGYGIQVEGEIFDTMIAHYTIQANRKHNMDDVAAEYLGYRTVTYEDLVGTGREMKRIQEVPLQDLSDYSCEDSDITFRLYEKFGKIMEDLELAKLCKEVEFPLVSVLAAMEERGVAIDSDYLASMSEQMESRLSGLTSEIHKVAGGPFNINSTQQLSEVLFKNLKLKTVRKTKTGFSTDVGVLESLRGEHPIIDLLLDYRQTAKLKSTYVDALPRLINGRSSRVHTSFNQTVTTTGRLSSSDPNLQNIPIRTEIGRSIRRAFIPGDPDAYMLSADYSQIELRVMAHISKDEGLIAAFQNNEDIHSTTASKVFSVSTADITREMRRKAKEINFGIMYGIGPFGLSSRLEISQSEAKDIISRYFTRFPRVRQYIGDTIESARDKGYVCTLLGRRRYFPEIRSSNQTVRQNAERQAINMPIQGTAADLIKLAMIRIQAGMKKERLNGAMLLQVHDELVFETPEKEIDALKHLVRSEMQNALHFSVPLQVEIGTGKNWLEAH